MSNTLTPEKMIDQILYGNAEVVDISSTDHEFASVAKGLYVGVGGDIVVDMGDLGTDILFANVPTGTFLPIFVDKVKKSGTIAPLIVGLY